MIGAQDFVRQYDWTFEYINRNYGMAELERYWREAIAFGSQRHAFLLVQSKGLEGMAEYWGSSLTSEEAGYRNTLTTDYFRIDMYQCPSKGLLLKTGQSEYEDYCQHCMGWIKPIMESTGFEVDHEHNHQGQCWWEMRPVSSDQNATGPPPLREDDVRLRADWRSALTHHWMRSAFIKPDGSPQKDAQQGAAEDSQQGGDLR